MDRLLKPPLYAAAGIPAYWRVELDGRRHVVVHVCEWTASYREVATVRPGEAVVVSVPFPVELRPAELAGPRRRA